MKGMLKIFLRNDQLIPAGIAFFLFNIGSNLLIIFGYNFFNFEFGYSEAGNLIFIWTTCLFTLAAGGIGAALGRMTKKSTLPMGPFALAAWAALGAGGLLL